MVDGMNEMAMSMALLLLWVKSALPSFLSFFIDGREREAKMEVIIAILYVYHVQRFLVQTALIKK